MMHFCFDKVRRIAALLLITCMINAMVLGVYTSASAANTANNDSKIMVSLGDSYSSGEGIEPFYGQSAEISKRVKDQDWLAHRSKNSWPGMLKFSSDDEPMSKKKDTNWFFRASSGATTDNMTQPQNKDYDRESQKGSEEIDPQLSIFDELGNKKVDYVTLTLGGNDADFVGIITDVVVGSTYLNLSGLSDKINNTWKEFYKKDGIQDKLVNSYKKISDKAGAQAQIIVAGYPRLLDETGKGFFVSQKEAEWVNSAVSNFNNAIEVTVNRCREAGIKISFVSVESAFKGHGAYSKNPYINEVYFGPKTKSQDLKAFDITSAYSMHPNYNGACAYARCVQAKIDELESNRPSDAALPLERDVVLVLDASGSMEGTPLNETKKAATKFVDTVFEQSAKYDSEAEIVSPFSTDSTSLKNSISNIRTGGSTDIEDGLATAEAMLSRSSAKKKIIVLMSDGVPNDGKVGEELIAYADELKQKDIYIYTLGFFEDLGSEKSSAQYLMERIASTGCHYEVTDANRLVYFFGDIADQINGQKYIYVRIACPVDVSVSYAGEELDSSSNNLNTRTSFGTLTFEDASDYGNYDSSYYSDSSDSDDTVKVLRLKEGTDYDVKIVGTGSGRMNYSIGFMDNEGEYTDLRRFNNIRITRRTVIDTVAEVSDNTILNVDEDGDGRYDIKYKAAANGYGKEVNYSYIVYILLSLVGILLILISILIIKTKINKKRKAR